jgi:mannose-6-phosphate isomerase-like protein (cupin superfamily)
MLEVYTWQGEGYQPLVFTPGWMVALLNWEPIFDRVHAKQMERHNKTDEVFVLLEGKAVLFTRADGQDFQAVEMLPGVLYNVPTAVWHNVIATRDVKLLIVEDRDTHIRPQDSEMRPITDEEYAVLDAFLPQWASALPED